MARRKSVLFTEEKVCFDGYLTKKNRGRGTFGSIKAVSWQERSFTLYLSKKLIYADGDVIKGEMDVSGAKLSLLTATDVGAKEDALVFHFEIENGAGESLVLAADASWRREKWMEQIRTVSDGTWVDDTPAIVSKLPPPGEAHTTDPDVKARLNSFCEQSPKCADCNAPSPAWASVNNGVTICTACSGVHRSLGVHISFVQSLNMDFWSSENLDAFIEKGPNERVNTLRLEYHVPASCLKASPNCSREAREVWIRAKYVEQRFVPEVEEGSGKVLNERLAAVSMEDPAASIFGAVMSESESGELSSPPVAKSIGEMEFIGVVMIKLISCSGLQKVDTFRNNDVYIRTKAALQSVDSKVVLKSLDPVFNQTLMLSWYGTSPLSVHVRAKTNKKDKEALGHIEVELADYRPLLESGEAIVLTDQPLISASSGSISLEVTFQDLT